MSEAARYDPDLRQEGRPARRSGCSAACRRSTRRRRRPHLARGRWSSSLVAVIIIGGGGTPAPRVRGAAIRPADAEPDRDGARHRVAVHLAAPPDHAEGAARRLRDRRLDRLRPRRGDHPVPLRREGGHALHPAPRHHADAGAGAAAHPQLRLRQRAAHHRGGARQRADGDDQLGDRLPPRRSRQDRAGPLLRRQHACRSSPRSASRWRCR